jgi:hypothetical protein
MKHVTNWVVYSLALVGAWVYGAAGRSWWTGEPASFSAHQLWAAPVAVGLVMLVLRLWRFLNTHDFVGIAQGRWVLRWLPRDRHGPLRLSRKEEEEG